MANRLRTLAMWALTLTVACGDPAPPTAKTVTAKDASSAVDTATSIDATTQDGVDVAAAADASGQTIPVQTSGYLSGGLLARELEVESALAHPLDWAAKSAEDKVKFITAWRQIGTDLAEDDAVWTARWQTPPSPAQRRILVLQGAIHVTAGAPVQLAIAQVGSVHVELGGQIAMEQRDVPDLTVWKTQVIPEATGWVALRIVYAPFGLRQHLQLWRAEQPEAWTALPAVDLAVDASPPGQLQAMHVVGTPTYTAVPLTVDANWPIALTILRDGQPVVQPEPATARSHQALDIPLPNNQSGAYKLVATDPWSRTYQAELGVITAKPVPNYEPGGLLATFFKGTKLADPQVARVDATVNFPNDTTAFGAWMPYDGFSVRWSGGLKVMQPGTYTVHFGADDGQRLWLDGAVVAENWSDHGTTYVSATLQLAAGWHPIVLEMYEQGGPGAALLEWEGPGIPRTIVPASALGYEPPAKPTDAPQITGSEAVRVGGAVRVRVKANQFGTLQITRKPTSGTVTAETWGGPADNWDRALADWGSGGGEVSVILTNLAGKATAPLTLTVPAAQ